MSNYINTPEVEGHRTGGFNSPLIPFRTHTWAQNNSFYAAVPQPYKDFYQRFVREWFHWYDGFVPNFHKHSNGIFSTRIAYTILHKLAQQTTSNKVLFDDNGVNLTKNNKIWGYDYNALSFSEEWAKKFNLHSKVTQGVEWGFAGGDFVLKLNTRGGDVLPSVHRKDSYFLDVGFNGEIEKISILIQNYTDMNRDKDGNARNFYLLEERGYLNGKPVERLSIKEGTGHTITYKAVDFHSANVDFKSLPNNVSKRLVKEFPNVRFGEWEDLAFDDLGVYLIKASENVSFAPSLPFGESLCSNNIHAFMSYDFYYSAFMTDMYNARGKLLLPKHMQRPDSFHDGGDHFTGFTEAYMQQIPYVKPDDQKPISLQFELRALEWREIRNTLLQTIATNIGISERTIASYLVPASEKPTAYEISSDENATANFIESQRPRITSELDKALYQVLKFYGFKDKVLTKFSRIGLSNFNNVVNQMSILRQNGLIDEKTALEKIYPDFTQAQIKGIMEALAGEREQKMNLEAKQKPVKSDTLEAHEDMIRMSNPSKPQE